MGKLSKREKVMLYVLAVFAIITALLFLLIMPGMQMKDELETQADEMEFNLAEMQAAISTDPIVKQQLDDNIKQIEELKKNFIPKSTSDDLDRYITGLLMDNGIMPQSLSILEVEKVEADKTDSTDETAQTQIDTVTYYTVQTVSTGQFASFKNLCQKVSDTQGVRIMQFVVNPTKAANVLESGENDFSMNIEFEVCQLDIE